MFGIFRPAPHQAPLPDAEVDSTYRRLRWQIFAGIFIGYAGYYLLRKNFSLAMPYLIEDGYSRGQLGVAMSAIAIAYGLSKFIMGLVSDRSNPRVFLPFGLLVSAAVMFIFGFAHWATSSVAIMFVLLFINGWAQGMGWPPSGRTMVHWWSQKERGSVVSVWNVAPQCRRRPDRPAVPARPGAVRRLALGLLRAGHRRRGRSRVRLFRHARHPAILRPAADREA